MDSWKKHFSLILMAILILLYLLLPVRAAGDADYMAAVMGSRFAGIMPIHPLILCHTILPVVLVPLSAFAWRKFAEQVFSHKDAADWFLPVFLTGWIAAAFLNEEHALFPIWQGKYIGLLIILPAFLCLILQKRNGGFKEKGFAFLWKAIALLALLFCSRSAACAAVLIWIGIDLIRLLEGTAHE